MKSRYLRYILALPSLLALGACNDYLDKMPDNRATIDSEEKVYKLLISAYPENGYVYAAEMASDNTDLLGVNNPYYDLFQEQLYTWADVTESNNEDPSRIWQSCYKAIATANQALQAIAELGGPESLNPARGEALLCRAYNHFILVNIFCQAYSEQHSETDLGVPYVTIASSDPNPIYERGTVAEVYRKMIADIEEGLPLIDDSRYGVPKYHFNQKAAYTFASRVYLFTHDWDKVIECSDKVLGSNPAEYMHDNAYLSTYPRDPMANISQAYVASSMKANFLLQTAYSNLGTTFGAYYTNSKYNHGAICARWESMNFLPWGGGSGLFGTANNNYSFLFNPRVWVYAGTNLDKALLPRVPYLFEYTDPVAGTGYRRTVYVPLTGEEALLNRAEAYAWKEEYSKTVSDLNIWINNNANPQYASLSVTEDGIIAWANNLKYYTPTAPTPKKELNPDFETITQGSDKEAFLHSVLVTRRVQFMHEGMRWFDVKRYGIKIYRRTIDGTTIVSVDDTLELRDNRRAMQIPKDAVTAGVTPNPR
ncbi:MAG: RagB/SusD family nutrient uptake outer membrane protein [Mediterranea sp.]|jgi:hypothetical protein|nr:RagB/SusD family nutrient uptake outer membrane protein [Mediterranea sp.]